MKAVKKIDLSKVKVVMASAIAQRNQHEMF